MNRLHSREPCVFFPLAASEGGLARERNQGPPAANPSGSASWGRIKMTAAKEVSPSCVTQVCSNDLSTSRLRTARRVQLVLFLLVLALAMPAIASTDPLSTG